MVMADLNQYIKKSHLRMVEKFKEDLEMFRQQTGDKVAELYEDAYTSFKLGDIKVENGILSYQYDDGRDFDRIVLQDPDTKEYYEDESLDSLPEIIKFWRKCLRRAKRYWSMDPDRLDKIQDGEIEDQDDEE